MSSARRWLRRSFIIGGGLPRGCSRTCCCVFGADTHRGSSPLSSSVVYLAAPAWDSPRLIWQAANGTHRCGAPPFSPGDRISRHTLTLRSGRTVMSQIRRAYHTDRTHVLGTSSSGFLHEMLVTKLYYLVTEGRPSVWRAGCSDDVPGRRMGYGRGPGAGGRVARPNERRHVGCWSSAARSAGPAGRHRRGVRLRARRWQRADRLGTHRPVVVPAPARRPRRLRRLRRHPLLPAAVGHSVPAGRGQRRPGAAHHPEPSTPRRGGPQSTRDPGRSKPVRQDTPTTSRIRVSRRVCWAG